MTTIPQSSDEAVEPSRLEKPIGSPIFVVGCGHSGTSLMRRLLGLHRRIYALPFETNMFLESDAAPRLTASILEMATITARTVMVQRQYAVHEVSHSIATIATLADALTGLANKARWVEKTPRHVYRMSTMLSAFPESKIILMIRDGRDVVVSLRDRFDSENAFEKAVRRWVDDNECAEPFWGHEAVLPVKLEALIADPAGTLRGVHRFIEEAYDDQAERFGDARHSDLDAPSALGPAQWAQYRDWLARQPLFDTRGKWKQRMSEPEKQVFKAIAGAMLIRFEYVTDLSW